MEYLLAICLPPVSVWITRGPLLALVSIPMTILFVFPGSVFALILLVDQKQREWTETLAAAIRGEPAPRATNRERGPTVSRGVRPLYVEPIDERTDEERQPYDPADDLIDRARGYQD